MRTENNWSNSFKINDFQCIWRNAVRLGFCNPSYNKINLPENHFLIRKLMSLALLPQEEIESEYQRIKSEGLMFFENTRFEDKLRDFFNYFENEWLIGVFKISEWCVFGQRHRTNNMLESYHNQLKNDMGLRPTGVNFLSE